MCQRAADLATGAKGMLEWKVEYTDSKADAALRSLRTGGKVGLAIGPSREVQSAEVEADLAATATVEQFPLMEGRQMVMMIAPGKKKTGSVAKPAADTVQTVTA